MRYRHANANVTTSITFWISLSENGSQRHEAKISFSIIFCVIDFDNEGIKPLNIFPLLFLTSQL